MLDEDVSARSSILIQLSNSQSHACNAVIARPRVPPCSPEGRLRKAIQRRSMILDCFVAYAPRNDAGGYTSASSRRDLRPSFASRLTLQETEGAGKAGCRPHPWSACSKKARGRTTGTSRTSRPSLRDGLRLIRDLPGAPGCLATVASETRKRLRQLNTSVGVSGPRDFAVRARGFSSYSPRASTASRFPRIVTTRTPLMWRRDKRDDRSDLPDTARPISCGMVTRRAVTEEVTVPTLVRRRDTSGRAHHSSICDQLESLHCRRPA